MAETVVTATGQLAGSEDKIFEPKWWEQKRYEKVGSQIVSKLKADAGLKTELRALFKSYTDKLSYHGLFQFLEKKLKMKL